MEVRSNRRSGKFKKISSNIVQETQHQTMKYNINSYSNLLLSIGTLLLALDFYLTLNLGFSLGFSTEIKGWARIGKHFIWLDLIVIFTMLLVMVASLILFNTKNKKLREKIIKIFLVDWDKFLIFINPYMLAFLDFVFLYKILIMHILGRY